MTIEIPKEDARIIFLYCITNLINGKTYIGQSVDTNSRWRGHRRDSADPKVPLHFAIKKYGAHNFNFEVIATCQGQDNANELETYLVSQYDSFVNNGKGYNATHGGANAPKTEAWLKVITQKAQERAPQTSEQMKKIAANRPEDYYDVHNGNQYNAGRVQPPEWKAMIQACNNTEEARAKKSATLKESYANGTRVSAQKGKPAWNKGKPGKAPSNKINWTDEQIEAIKNDSRSSYKVAADYGVSSFVIQKLRKQFQKTTQ